MFYISVSNGLLQGSHQARMGAAVWQFMWLIDKVTRIDADGWGWVLGGIVLTTEKGPALTEQKGPTALS